MSGNSSYDAAPRTVRSSAACCQGVVFLIARILLCVIFIVSGISKITGWSMMLGFMQSKGLPMPAAGLVLAIIIELGGGLALLLGIGARWAALVMFLFLIPTTLIFHNYWAAPAAMRQEQFVNFMKNLAIMGGLLMVFATGSGPISVDRLWRRRL